MIKNLFRDIILNALGKSVPHKILVIESDDWGAVRMYSQEAYNYFQRNNFKVEDCPFNRYDILEDKTDIEDLVSVLTSFKDSIGNPARFTINYIVANPDFNKIRDSGFSSYYFESVLSTYQNSGRDEVHELMKKGVDGKVFEIQFHGREHVNVSQWMNALKSNNYLAREAFKFNMYSVHNKVKSNARTEFLETFATPKNLTFGTHKAIIEEGVKVFQQIWGRYPESFIAPCYVWSSELENYLYDNGVSHLQSTFVQKHPDSKVSRGFKKIRHFQGQQNQNSQLYTVRNVLFEPSINKSHDWIDSAMKQIDMAFLFNKPAIISSHRLNYVGGLCQNNKSENLKLLRKLLQEVTNKYKNVIFLTSSELMSLYKKLK